MSRFSGSWCLAFLLFLALTGAAAGDFPQLSGWPKTVTSHEAYNEMRGLTIADIDDDPELEIIMATCGQQLHAWDYDGTKLFSKNLTGLAQTVPAVGDVTGDEAPEIIVTTRPLSGNTPTPTLHIFSHAGVLLKSSPMAHTGSLFNAPTLANLDGDAKLEIIIGEAGSGTGWLYALNGDLSSVGGDWPATLDHVPATSAAAGDIDDDGEIEVVVCSFYSLYAFEADGSSMAGFPVTFSGEDYSYGSPALADLNGDGTLEILTTTHGDHNRVHAIRANGTELTGWPYDLGDAWTFCPPSVADLDHDGDPEVVVGRSGGTVADDNLFVIRHDGTDFAPYPLEIEGGVEGNFVIADLTGDAKAEIIFTTNLQYDGQGYLYAVNTAGETLAGWPLRPAGFTYLNGPTLADVNLDGIPELGAVGAQSDGNASINLYTFADYAFGPGGVHWRTYQSDNRRSGLYQPLVPGDDDDDDAADDDDVIDDDDVVDDDDAVDDDDDLDDDSTDDDQIDDDDSATDDDDTGDDDHTGGNDDDDDDDKTGSCDW